MINPQAAFSSMLLAGKKPKNKLEKRSAGVYFGIFIFFVGLLIYFLI